MPTTKIETAHIVAFSESLRNANRAIELTSADYQEIAEALRQDFKGSMGKEMKEVAATLHAILEELKDEWA